MQVGRPSCPNLSYTLEKMQEARDSRRKKRPPLPPKNLGENAGKTQQGEPTNPEERKTTRAGGGKTRQGEPHQPREKHKAPLDAKKEKHKPNEIA